MATYYKWRKNNFSYTEERDSLGRTVTLRSGSFSYFKVYCGNSISIADNGDITILDEIEYTVSSSGRTERPTGNYLRDRNSIYYTSGSFTINPQTYPAGTLSASKTIYKVSSVVEVGAFVSYVYSTSSSAYPNGEVSGSYYYDQRTTVTSPTNPSQISYPSTINSLSTTISWQPSTSNTSYPVSRYELSYSTNGGSSWQVAGTTEETTYQFGISSPEVTQIQFRVRAMDTNSQYSDYVTGSNSTVQYVPANPPVLVLPNNAKLGDTITISWNSVTDATNYILQRKVDGSEWTQIYSGANLSTTNLVDNLGISYRIAFNVGSNFTSEWSQEYRLNTYEKLIEMTYLGDDGNYMPLYPRTITSAVVNVSDLINTVSLSGTYQGNGFETNSIALENSVDPKVAIITNSKQETTLVTNFNENNMTIKDSNNELGETYNYVIIGNNKNK